VSAGEDRTTSDRVAADDARILALDLEEPSTAEALFRNVERILPLLHEEATEGHLRGRITPLAARAMRSAGLFAVTFPKSDGGLELSIPDLLQYLTQIARVDAGTAWAAAALSTAGAYAAQLDEEAYAELYPHHDLPTVYSSSTVTAVERPDGYLVRAGSTWGFGSGIFEAAHYLGGIDLVDEAGDPVLEDDGQQRSVGVWLPPAKVTVLDDWDSMGIRASGSSSFRLEEDALIPKSHALSNLSPLPDRPGMPAIYRNPGTMYFCIMSIAVGLAQHLLDLTVQQVRRKMVKAQAEPSPLELANLEEALSEVNLIVTAARGMADHLQDALEVPGRVLSRDEAAAMWSFGPSLRRRLTHVLDLCADLYGAGYVQNERSEFRRIVTDIAVLRTHVQFRPGANSGNVHDYGRALSVLQRPDSETTLLDAPWIVRTG
jgi:alkylation response protein AidB-like acyl-CoA dehydrogenase